MNEDHNAPDAPLVPRDFIISPSAYPRIIHCPASRCYMGPKPPEHPGAEWGKAVHTYLELVMTKSRDHALDWVDDNYPRAAGLCREINVASLPFDPMVEPEFLFYLRGSVEFAIGKHNAPDSLYEKAKKLGASKTQYARGDVIFEDKVGWHAEDYKSGKNEIVKATGKLKYDPKDSIQLKTSALGILRAIDRSAKKVHVAYNNVVGSRKEQNFGEITKTPHVYTRDELLEHEKWMKHMHLVVLETRAEKNEEGISPEFKPGDWCEWCKVKPVCPAQPA